MINKSSSNRTLAEEDKINDKINIIDNLIDNINENRVNICWSLYGIFNTQRIRREDK